MTDNAAIRAQGLVRRYGAKTALAGVDFEVQTGTVTAILGPNGAGKTTTVRILTTLTTSDEGEAIVAGFNVRTHPHEVRRRIGLAAQDATVDPILTGRENLVMLGELHQLTRNASSQRAAQLLSEFSLEAAADRPVSGYSGGMRRRLDLAATLVAHPAVLFLDEPTTGLDPRGRMELWGVLDTLVERGTTVLLTTQYLDEAERLADDIIVIDGGRIIARGDSRQLKRLVGGDHIQMVVEDSARLADAERILREVTGAHVAIEVAIRTLVAPAANRVETLVAVARRLADDGIGVEDLSLRQPTLDEVFMALTGSPAEDGVVVPDGGGVGE